MGNNSICSTPFRETELGDTSGRLPNGPGRQPAVNRAQRQARLKPSSRGSEHPMHLLLFFPLYQGSVPKLRRPLLSCLTDGATILLVYGEKQNPVHPHWQGAILTAVLSSTPREALPLNSSPGIAIAMLGSSPRASGGSREAGRGMRGGECEPASDRGTEMTGRGHP